MASTYKALTTVTVGSGGVSSVTFSNIPQTYTDLLVKVSGETNRAATTDYYQVKINGASTNASSIVLYGTGSGASSTQSAGDMTFNAINGDTATVGAFGNSEFLITNYATNDSKLLTENGVTETNASGGVFQFLTSGTQIITEPVTSILFTPAFGSAFQQYSTFTLYGIFNADVSSTPATPTIGTATAGVQSASITFTGVPNAASYTMTSTPGSVTGTGTTSPITVSGLTGGTAYTFKVKSNNPIGSSAESAASNSVTPTVPLSYESIATINAGGQTQVAFTSIPQTYSHLQLRMMVRSTINTGGYTQATVVLRINGSAIRGGIYAFHEFNGNGSTAASYGTTSSQEAYGVAVPTANIASNVFGVSTIDFLDYANTNKYKTWRGITGWDDNSSLGFARLFSGVMLETNAISSMYFSTDYNFAWASGTVFALYGIKSA